MITFEYLKKQVPALYEHPLLEKILDNAVYKSFQAGETVVNIGQYIKSVPLVISGVMRIVREDKDGQELFLYYLNYGETCAASLTCCMADKKSNVKAVAEENTEILMIPVIYMDLWTRDYPSWKAFVMSSYQSRFQDLLETIDNIAFKKMDERLLDYLYQKAKIHQQTLIETTHQQIAQDLHSSREVISRLLKQLERKGIIKLGRNKVEILEMKPGMFI